MRKYLLVGGMVLLGLLLGATVFREPVAWAAQAVDARITAPLDVSGNVKVHEAGTANVNVTNSSLAVTAASPITGGGAADGCKVSNNPCTFPSQTASALSIHLTAGVAFLSLERSGSIVATFLGPDLNGNASTDLALARPISFDTIVCNGGPTDECTVSWVGNSP
jgi:hypothetical protein